MRATKIIEVPELNNYDYNRIIRENIQALSHKNQATLTFITGDNGLPGGVRHEFALQVSNNASESMYLIMSQEQGVDLETYTKQSPLFREE